MPTDRADAAAAAVDADEVLATAQSLIRARSENPGTTEDEAADVASAALRQLGASPETVRGEGDRPSVLATIGGDAGPTLAWNGHLDTVPAGSLDTWSVDPFAGEVVDGRLIGRGACDMKGPIAAALAAASAVVRAGIELAGSLTFHLVADEELAGTHGTQVLRDRGLLTQGAAIVGEPSDLQVGARRARRGLGDGDHVRRGGPRLPTGARRERDHVDGALPASPGRGGARHRAPALRPARPSTPR